MRTRVIALSALAVMVALGVLGMHALGIGHGSGATSRADMAHERETPADVPSTTGAEKPEPSGDDHTSLLSTLCVAILSVGLAFAATAVAVRTLARSRRAPSPLIHWVRLATRSFAGPPPPLLAPLRT